MFKELAIIFIALLYALIGYTATTFSKDPDFKTFVFIFWPLLILYYFLYRVVATVRRLVLKFIVWSIGGGK